MSCGTALMCATQFLPGSYNGITIWIPLQETPTLLGPLEVIPGSHREGLLPKNDATDVKRSELTPMRDDDEFVTIPLGAGQARVFSNFLIHRSGPNRSNMVRFSIQVRFNDLASPEYARRKFTLDHLVPEQQPQYSRDA